MDSAANAGFRYADRNTALLCRYSQPECHSALAAAFTAGAMAVRTAHTIGVIDWCDGSTPSVVVGDSAQAVHKAAVVALHTWATSIQDQTPEVLRTLPNLHDPSAVSAWLERLSDEASSPEFALLAARDLVRAQ